MDSLVSIVTPFYNSGKCFEKTLESVLNQTHSNWEWLIVDDNSNKNESDRLDELASNDKRIKVFHNDQNKGPAYCRNLAIKKASGEYIAFLDGDDCWSFDKLEKQLKFMTENHYDFTGTYYYVFDENQGKTIYKVRGPKKCSHKKFIRLNYVGCLTVVYKKSICPDLSIPEDIKKRNDYALWLKLSEHATCHLLNEYLATYVKHTSNSVSSGKRSSIIKYHRDVFMKLYGHSKFRASLCAYRNAFYYLLKELVYKSKI